MSWEYHGTQRHIFSVSQLVFESANFFLRVLSVWLCRCFTHFLMQYHFISFHFFPFAILFTFVNVVLYIHWFGFCRSHSFNRCVRPSICPELIVSQTVSIEFNLVGKIHRKKTREREKWVGARERKKLNTEWREAKSSSNNSSSTVY